MKRKIILYLLSLFFFFSAGAITASVYIQNTTLELARLIKLHQIEDLRQHLIMSIQTVQSDLYTVGTSMGKNLDSIVQNVSELEKNAKNCLSCHHEPEIAKNLDDMLVLINDYQGALSQYITASANFERIDNLKFDAGRRGNLILVITETMSVKASEKLRSMTHSVMQKITRAKIILYLTIVLSLLLGVFIAAKLTMFITKPVNELVTAARAVAMGEVGDTISYQDKTEFGELADVFNRMSLSLEKGYTALHDEIIERKKTEEALRQSEERYAIAARGANDGLWDWNLGMNKVYFSDRWKSMLGYDENDVGNNPEEWFNLVHPDDRKDFQVRVSAHIEGLTSHLECEYRILHKDGTYRWILNRGLAVRDIGGKAYRMAGSQTDITERKIAEEQLIYDAFHDALTGLPNRALFMDRLQHRLRQAQKNSQRHPDYLFAVLFFDLDRFKVINDSLGHIVGDHLLIAVSQRLTQLVRPGDTVARLGGDEFAMILEDLKDREHVEQITGRIEKDLALPFYIDGNEIFTTASIGISLSSPDYDRPEEMVRDADIAMYQVKSRGKANHEVFEAGMYTSTVARLHLETDLRKAVEHQEFVMHYQPIMELSSDRLIGFEALVRWNHPQRGLIYPMDFIPLAEETGLIIQIGEWIINESCRQLSAWRTQYEDYSNLKVSVNISSRQFLQHDLPDKIMSILGRNNIEGKSITLEITESMLMENFDAAIAVLNRLQAIGMHIHLDDFGTGYSSLSYIHRFPVNALKIDRSFIEKMHQDDENMQIVKTIIALAHNLNLDLIAEGLETSEQVLQLKDLNCHYGQGFFLSRPMNAAAIETWMGRKHAKFLSIKLPGSGNKA
ncbi:MAG: EAL domain-containing protein [Nitrospirae bacterium]|nr:EAL domain-containing protein [Nitrospirota bacterium]